MFRAGTATNSVMPPSTVTPSSSSFSQRLTRPTLQWRQMPHPMQISTATEAPSGHLRHALADGHDLPRDLVADDEAAPARRVDLVVDPLIAAADPRDAHADEDLPGAHGRDRHVLEDDAALGRILDDGEHAGSLERAREPLALEQSCRLAREVRDDRDPRRRAGSP